MATKISELTAAGALTGTETVPVVQSSTTKRTTAQAIANLAPSGSTVPTVSFVLGNNGGDHSTTSTTFVDLAAAYTINMPAAVGDRLEIEFRAIGNHSAANGTINFTFAINGTDQAPTNGIWVDVFVSNGQLYPIHLNYWRTVVSGDLSGGNVPIKVRYMGNAGTKTIKNAVAGDYLPVFSVKNWKQ